MFASSFVSYAGQLAQSEGSEGTLVSHHLGLAVPAFAYKFLRTFNKTLACRTERNDVR